MKKIICTFIALLMCVLLALSMVSCSHADSDPDTTKASSQQTTREATETVHNYPFSEEWINKKAASFSARRTTIEDIEITEIYSDCFFAEYITPLPYAFKFNGVLSDEWCVGDHITVTCKNRYTVERDDTNDYDRDRVEADLLDVEASDFELTPGVAYKPVIYLYPKEKTEVSVKLDLRGELLTTNPLYNDGWRVTAEPDGTLTNSDGTRYDYLFWEGRLEAEYDLSQGFCVAGCETEKFLNSALAQLGLSRSEADDFMDFWLEHMEKNPYNIISFQTEAYTNAAELTVIPQPDSVIRVYMVYRSSGEFVELPEQQLTAPERSGFTVVEWGGAVLK